MSIKNWKATLIYPIYLLGNGSNGMYLNPLQASLFAYPHLYSSAVNPASLHLHNNGGSAGGGQHQQQHLVAGSGTGAEGHHQHHSPALDEYGHEMSNPANPRGEPTDPTYLDSGDPEGQTGPIRGAYGSGRSEHGVWRPY